LADSALQLSPVKSRQTSNARKNVGISPNGGNVEGSSNLNRLNRFAARSSSIAQICVSRRIDTRVAVICVSFRDCAIGGDTSRQTVSSRLFLLVAEFKSAQDHS